MLNVITLLRNKSCLDQTQTVSWPVTQGYYGNKDARVGLKCHNHINTPPRHLLLLSSRWEKTHTNNVCVFTLCLTQAETDQLKFRPKLFHGFLAKRRSTIKARIPTVPINKDFAKTKRKRCCWTKGSDLIIANYS